MPGRLGQRPEWSYFVSSLLGRSRSTLPDMVCCFLGNKLGRGPAFNTG
jgi:hypothetical protein